MMNEERTVGPLAFSIEIREETMEVRLFEKLKDVQEQMRSSLDVNYYMTIHYNSVGIDTINLGRVGCLEIMNQGLIIYGNGTIFVPFRSVRSIEFVEV